MYRKDDQMREYSKALGEIEARLLTSLASQDRNIFTTAEAQKVGGRPLAATHSLLSGLVKKKWLIRLVPGKYLIVPLSAGEKGEYSENWHVIAKHLIEPAPYYISHYSALDTHEMITQPVLTVYISSPVRRLRKKILGATYRFVYLKPKDIWGIEEVWATPNQKVTVSNLERTIIDCLDRPDLCGGLSEAAKGLWAKRDSIDYQKLVKYAKRIGRKSVAKRLGFILETYGLDDPETLSDLKQMLTASYASLDPTLPPSGRYVSSWRVRANVDPEELKAIIAA